MTSGNDPDLYLDGLTTSNLIQMLQKFPPNTVVEISGLHQDTGIVFRKGKVSAGGGYFDEAVFIEEYEDDEDDEEDDDENEAGGGEGI